MVSNSHLFLLFSLLLPFLPSGNSDLAADRDALLRLSSGVRGNTLRWNKSDPTPCSWQGVHCDNQTNRVIELRLPGDRLFGQIPPNSIGNLTHLRTLSLRSNSLTQPLPSDLASCTELRNLFLNENKFAGEIPAVLFSLTNLVRLNLSRNNFSGEISVGFNNLTKLTTLYLQHNQLTGSLPELKNLSRLNKFNVSFNRLNGSIPSSLERFSFDSFVNNSLCGSPLHSCPNGGNKLSGEAIAGIVIGSFFGLFLILAISFILWRKYGNRKISRHVTMSPMPPSPVKSPDEFRSYNPVIVQENHRFSSTATPTRARNENRNGGNDGLVFVEEGVGDFSLEELLTASAEVFGKKGTFGSTYKAYLEGGGEVIVKRLRNVCVSEREFREKVEGLGVLVHENLVPPKAYYYGREEKLLIYDWMPMGSLSALLHGNKVAERSTLTWEIRSRIALDAARGIEYLHSLGPNVAHGNIKSSNIFLTDEGGACVSEHGITQLVSSTSTPNLIGYRAPEAMDSRKISQKADVYSFGVMLLELLTGKDETEALNEEGIDLPRWVQSVVEKMGTIDVFDPELLTNHNIEEQMVQLLNLAIYCTSRDPERRPSMVEVTKQIKKICGRRQHREIS